MPDVCETFLEGAKNDAGCAARGMPDQPVHNEASIQLKISPESVRFIAYVFFWGMALFAICITKFVTAAVLLEGPSDGSTCAPFENGKGFDIYEDSHLMRTLGFNNVSFAVRCIYLAV